jgi:demethoxyubiquinone hydroxylase (CLK1/Coq7/Cat5 family)
MADNEEANRGLMDKLQKLRDDELEHHDTGVHYEGMEAPFYGGVPFYLFIFKHFTLQR